MPGASSISASPMRVRGEFPPVPISATIAADGVTMTVVFSQDVTSADFTAGFALTADGSPVAISSGSVAGDTVTFTVATVDVGQVCALAYDSGPGDVAGAAKPLYSFSMAVTNESEQGGAPVCTYALNASEATVLAVLAGFGATGKLTMSNGDQTGSYTAAGSLGSASSQWAIPDHNGSNFMQVIDVGSTRKVALELHLTGTDLTAASTNVIDVLGVIATAAGAPFMDLRLSAPGGGSAGTFGLNVSLSGGGPSLNDSAAASAETLLILLDGTANGGAGGNVRIYRAGDPTPFDFSPGAFTPGDFVLAESIQEPAGLDAAEAGKTFSLTWRTSIADITMAALVPGGYVDACGNAF